MLRNSDRRPKKQEVASLQLRTLYCAESQAQSKRQEAIGEIRSDRTWLRASLRLVKAPQHICQKWRDQQLNHRLALSTQHDPLEMQVSWTWKEQATATASNDPSVWGDIDCVRVSDRLGPILLLSSIGLNGQEDPAGRYCNSLSQKNTRATSTSTDAHAYSVEAKKTFQQALELSEHPLPF